MSSGRAAESFARIFFRGSTRLAHTLPRTLHDALYRFNGSRALKEILGQRFMDAVSIVKESELTAYQRVISSWEREHLLLNV